MLPENALRITDLTISPAPKRWLVDIYWINEIMCPSLWFLQLRLQAEWGCICFSFDCHSGPGAGRRPTWWLQPERCETVLRDGSTAVESSHTPEGNPKPWGCACLLWEPEREELLNRDVGGWDQTSEERKAWRKKKVGAVLVSIWSKLGFDASGLVMAVILVLSYQMLGEITSNDVWQYPRWRNAWSIGTVWGVTSMSVNRQCLRGDFSRYSWKGGISSCLGDN